MSDKKNNSKDFIDHLEFLDDDIIESAYSYPKVKKAVTWKKTVSLAACFALVLTGVFVGMKALKDSEKEPSGIFSESVSNSEMVSHAYEEDINVGKEDFDVVSKWESENNYSPNLSQNGVVDGEIAWGEDSAEDRFEENDFQNSSLENIEEESEGVPTTPQNKLLIDDLNKLAYYSGWTILKENNALNALGLNRKVKLLSNSALYMGEYAVDVSSGTELEELLPNYGFETSIDTEWEKSNEYEGLIPIDPGFEGDIVAYAVYELTVKSVDYFKIYLSEKCFLTSQVGDGKIEVMILDVEIDNGIDEKMIVFKNGKSYFSCLMDGFELKDNGNKIFRFTSSKYVSNFSIVKAPAYNMYDFTVTFEYNGDNISEIDFETENKKAEFISDTYTFANNVNVSNTAFGLNENLYKNYLEEVISGVTPPILPELPKLPIVSQPPESSDEVKENYSNVGLEGFFIVEGTLETPTGYISFSPKDENATILKTNFDNDELCKYVDSLPEDENFVAVWIKGKARISESKISYGEKGAKLQFDYVLFSKSEEYSIFFFAVENNTSSVEVELCPVDYSISVVATFTTENKYDYLDDYGTENEDEYIINLCENETYMLYKNDVLIYSNCYKVSSGYVCLVTDGDTHYLEVSPVATFVYKIDGRNRIFELI